jgi:hypothetical protein
MKTLLAVLLFLSATPALAVSDRELAQQAYDAYYLCKVPPDAPSQEASDKACAERDGLWKKVKERGYCFFAYEQDFVPCSIVGDTDAALNWLADQPPLLPATR